MTADESAAKTKSLVRQCQCLAREVKMREHVYPRWVAAGKMTQEKATAEIEAMREAHETVKQVMSAHIRENPIVELPSTGTLF